MKILILLTLSMAGFSMDRATELSIYKSGIGTSDRDVSRACIQAIGKYGEGYDVIFDYITNDTRAVEDIDELMEIFLKFKNRKDFKDRSDKIIEAYPDLSDGIKLKLKLANFISDPKSDPIPVKNSLLLLLRMSSFDQGIDENFAKLISEASQKFNKEDSLEILGAVIPYIDVGRHGGNQYYYSIVASITKSIRPKDINFINDDEKKEIVDKIKKYIEENQVKK